MPCFCHLDRCHHVTGAVTRLLVLSLLLSLSLGVHGDVGKGVVSSVAGQLKITEIMYNPPVDGVDFIEFQNTGLAPLDVSGVHFSEGLLYTFPEGTTLAAGAFYVLAADGARFSTRYPGVTLDDVYQNGLNNDEDRLTVDTASGTPFFSLRYEDETPWPPAADGLGFSLVLRDAAADEDDPVSWRASGQPGGSPGAVDVADPIGAVLINEALTHTDAPQLDGIEIHNPTTATVDLRGWYLTDDRSVPQKARIPDSAEYLLGPGGFTVINETVFRDAPGTADGMALPGFALSASGGEDVYLFSATGSEGRLTGYGHGYAIGGAENGVTFGRYVAGDGTGISWPRR